MPRRVGTVKRVISLPKRKPIIKEKSSPFADSDVEDQCFFLPVKIISLNQALEKGNQTFHAGRFKNNEWAKWKTAITKKLQWQFILQGVKPMGWAWFFFTFQESDQRRNKDNVTSVAKKIIFDALVKSNLLPNDGWKEIVKWEEVFEVKKGDEGILVRMIRPGTTEANNRIRYKVHQILESHLSMSFARSGFKKLIGGAAHGSLEPLRLKSSGS